MNEKPRKGYSMRKSGQEWGSLAIRKDLLDRIKRAAAEKGIGAAFLAQQILEDHFPPKP